LDFEERIEPGSLGWLKYGADHLARYRFAAQFTAGQRVLDAGTGPGYGAAILKAMGASSVQAVDIEAETIARAKASFPDVGVEYLVDDCQMLGKVRGPIDVICSFENIEHLPDPVAFLAAAALLLGETGILIVSTPDKATSSTCADGKPANPFHVQEWTRAEFSTLLMQTFETVEMYSEVIGFSVDSRRQFASELNAQFSQLWSNPFIKAHRVIRKILGSPLNWPDLSPLLDLAESDLHIVPASVAHVFGTPHCHLAICRAPHRFARPL